MSGRHQQQASCEVRRSSHALWRWRYLIIPERNLPAHCPVASIAVNCAQKARRRLGNCARPGVVRVGVYAVFAICALAALVRRIGRPADVCRAGSLGEQQGRGRGRVFFARRHRWWGCYDAPAAQCTGRRQFDDSHLWLLDRPFVIRRIVPETAASFTAPTPLRGHNLRRRRPRGPPSATVPRATTATRSPGRQRRPTPP